VSLALAALSGFTSIAAGFVVALGRCMARCWSHRRALYRLDAGDPGLVVLVWAFFALPIVPDHDGAVLRPR